MNLTISGQKIEITEALKNYITEKMKGVEKFTSNNVGAEVRLHVSKHRYHIHTMIKGDGNCINSEAEDPENMYRAIDACIDKLEKQFRRGKKDFHKHKLEKEAERKNLNL